MTTITKKELVDRVAESTDTTSVVVKKIVQNMLDAMIVELGRGNRLEFRDFGVFLVRVRAARMGQNPRTLEKVQVPAKRLVKFKSGRIMKKAMGNGASSTPVAKAGTSVKPS